MALSADKIRRKTSDSELAFPAPVGATAVGYVGSLLAYNAAGYVVPAANTVGYTIAGVARAAFTNATGQDGDVTVWVERGQVEAFTIHPTTAVPDLNEANCGQVVYAFDDEQITDVINGTGMVAVGTLLWIDAAGRGMVQVGVFPSSQLAPT